MEVGGLVLTGRRAAHVDVEQLKRDAHVALKATFGLDTFRGQQLDAILAALQGRDSFVLMPTGGGKSLCYGLIPAIKKRGLVLVVSPLIALMQDQVQGFRARGLRADFLSSTRTEADRRRLLADVQAREPETQLLFVTPELLATEGFMACLRNAYTAGSLLLAAIDEAHCISSWGHDFRSSYRQLWSLRRELPRLPLMALTATAAERVQKDIVAQLRLRDPLLLRASFNRPEIAYEVRYLDLMRSKEGIQPLQSPLPDIIAMLEHQASAHGSSGDGGSSGGGGSGGEGSPAKGRPQRRLPGGALIYCHRREDVDRVAGALSRRGFACAAYHAGLPDATRARVLEEWRARRLDVVAATVAFGMGVDRADVRLVLHYSLPKSLEGFYQEAGRAGRDGAASQSIVYYATDDRQRQEFVLGKGDEERQERRRQQQQGQAGGSSAGGGGGADRPTQLVQFGQVVKYCLSARCRRATVLQHFGEQPPPPPPGGAAHCCDVCCDASSVAAALRELSTVGAQRRQRFAGGKHMLDFGGSGGGGGGSRGGGRGAPGALEFETSWATEGLDFDAEGPSRALQESDGEEDAIQGSSDDEEELAAAATAMQQAQGMGTGNDRVFAAMERVELRHEQEQEHQRGSKKARLLAKLEDGGSRLAAGVGPSPLSAALRQAATCQLAAALSGNATLAIGSSQAAAVAAALEQQLAAGASKPIYQSKTSNLVLQLKKAQAAAAVPALTVTLSSCSGDSGGRAAGGSAAAAAAAAVPATMPAQHLQEQVAEALRLAAAVQPPSATDGGSSSDVGRSQEAAAAAAALQVLEAAPVTADLLQQTGAGKQVQKLRKHGVAAVAAAAAACVSAWKARVLAGSAP